MWLSILIFGDEGGIGIAIAIVMALFPQRGYRCFLGWSAGSLFHGPERTDITPPLSADRRCWSKHPCFCASPFWR